MSCQPVWDYFMPRVKESHTLYAPIYIFCVIVLVFVFCARSYDIKYSYLTQIDCAHLYGFK